MELSPSYSSLKSTASKTRSFSNKSMIHKSLFKFELIQSYSLEIWNTDSFVSLCETFGTNFTFLVHRKFFSIWSILWFCFSNVLIFIQIVVTTHHFLFPVQTLCFVTNLSVLSLSMIIRYHYVYEFLSVVAITTLTSLFQSKDVLL